MCSTGTPARRARSKAKASFLSPATTARFSGYASSKACRFVPEPDASTAKREPSGSRSDKLYSPGLRDLPDPPGIATYPSQSFKPRLRLSQRHDRAEPNAEVEDPAHLAFGHAAERTYEPEDRRFVPRSGIEACPEPPEQAWEVPHESAPRHVRHPPNLDRPAQSLYLSQICPMRLEVYLSAGPVQILRNVLVGDPGVREHLAGQRVAVGVQSAGCQAEHGVAGPRPLTAYFLAPLARPHAHADDLEVSLPVDTRHLRGLAADERHAESSAGFCGAADYVGDGFGI